VTNKHQKTLNNIPHRILELASQTKQQQNSKQNSDKTATKQSQDLKKHTKTIKNTKNYT